MKSRASGYELSFTYFATHSAQTPIVVPGLLHNGDRIPEGPSGTRPECPGRSGPRSSEHEGNDEGCPSRGTSTREGWTVSGSRSKVDSKTEGGPVALWTRVVTHVSRNPETFGSGSCRGRNDRLSENVVGSTREPRGQGWVRVVDWVELLLKRSLPPK